MVDTSIKQKLLTAATGTDTVRLSYAEAVRAALLIGVYEGAWDEDTVVAALEWWSALPSVLADRPGWQFTLRDYEPAWICESQGDDFMAVTVSTDDAGRIRYEVDISRGGQESAVMCPALPDLEILLVNTPT
ncbi:hypothetical protein [Streptomyces mirabilis]|uniref:hypothetical protein n=1 Tax=Streptomyces mirabilis TaxID=68239 RepID=UPI0036D16B65